MADPDQPGLEPAPSTPIADGEPAFGTYGGAFDDTSLRSVEGGIGAVTRWFREKRWQWFSVADDVTAVGGAIVDAGPIGTVFCWVADREREELLLDVSRVLPSVTLTVSDVPADGTVASVRFGRRPLTIARDGTSVTVRGSIANLTLDVHLESPPSRAVTAVCPVDGGPTGAVNVTQKELAWSARGTVAIDGERRSIADGVGLLDYTHGLLARETRWRWGFGVGLADGVPVGFNAVTGHNDGLENAIWIDGDRRPVGSVTVERPGAGDAPTDAWRLATVDGAVDVSLAVEAERVANTDVGVFASRYRQPVGRWSGRIDGHEVDELYGVAEVHQARW